MLNRKAAAVIRPCCRAALTRAEIADSYCVLHSYAFHLLPTLLVVVVCAAGKEGAALHGLPEQPGQPHPAGAQQQRPHRSDQRQMAAA